MVDSNEGTFGFKNKFFHFQGETLDGKPDGPGLLRLSNGVTVQGEFIKGELKGPGTKRWPDGSIFYGTFENGEPHGFGRHFSVANLQDFEGYYERGYKKGMGTLTDHTQGTVFKGEFNRDFPNGKGILTAIGGDLISPLNIKGYWENGKLHGLAMATMANGDTAVGMCEGGLWTGSGSFTTRGYDGSLPQTDEDGAINPSSMPCSTIVYKGPFAEGRRAEVPDSLKLRSSVLLFNRAPLEKTDPDDPGEGIWLWGTKPPMTRSKGIPRSPLRNEAGRVGGSNNNRTSQTTNSKLSPRQPTAEANQATLLVTAPCLTPLRLQVALATKSYKTVVLTAMNNDARSSVCTSAPGMHDASISSGRTSLTPTALSLATKSIGADSRGHAGSLSVVRDLKASSSREKTSRNNNGHKKGHMKGRAGGDEVGEHSPTFVTEEILNVQRSESGRPLFARLYNIRSYMAGSVSAEEWASEYAREEFTRRLQASGIRSHHNFPFTLDPSDLEKENESRNVDDEVDGGSQDEVDGGITPAESNFAPMSVDTKSTASSPSSTPRQMAMSKTSVKTTNKERKSDSYAKPAYANKQSPCPLQSKSEMLMSLIRYLSPLSKRDALDVKSLPTGVVESVFGVGGTPPQLSPRTRPGTSSPPLGQTSPRLSPTSVALFPPPSKIDAKADSASTNNVNHLCSSRPHSAAGVTDNGGAVSRTATNTQKAQHYDFPTEEELCSLCTDGTASFEFFLPAEGEYLLEVFACGDVQLSPGNEILKREFATALFVPLLSLGASFSGVRSDEGAHSADEEVTEDEEDEIE